MTDIQAEANPELLRPDVRLTLTEAVDSLKALILPRVVELEQEGKLPLITVGVESIGCEYSHSSPYLSLITKKGKIPGILTSSVEYSSVILTSEDLFSVPMHFKHHTMGDYPLRLPSWPCRSKGERSLWLDVAEDAAKKLDYYAARGIVKSAQ